MKSQTEQDVFMADGTSSIPIKGMDTIKIDLSNDSVIELHNVLYVPDLNTSLFSVKEHMRYTGCYFHAENNTATITFPEFCVTADVRK